MKVTEIQIVVLLYRGKEEIHSEIELIIYKLKRLVGWALWHINFCRLFNAKSIFM